MPRTSIVWLLAEVWLRQQLASSANENNYTIASVTLQWWMHRVSHGGMLGILRGYRISESGYKDIRSPKLKLAIESEINTKHV